MKKQKIDGITLIALVITIVVLLILASVSIATLTGDNGILSKANNAKTETEKANIKEQVQIAVLGSYDANGRLNIDKLKEELEKIEGTVTITDTDGGFPITVTVDRYSFIIDENGNIEPAGPKPTVDQSSIQITLKDGKEIPTDGVEEGTELKITFTASIEDGTITNVTPGSVQNGKITYTTTGTEKEVTFNITGKVGNETYDTPYKVSLKEYYKKAEVEAGDIAKAPSTFYGAEVTGYTCQSNGVSKWRIFYAGKEPGGTEDNIYLIADDYINYDKAPKGQGNNEIYKNSNYRLSFDNVYKDYKGSEWILGRTVKAGKEVENSLAKKWLNKYFNYTPDDGTTYPNQTSENTNIRAVAYMMDTEQWSVYAGDKAKYAIGGPPIEMYVKSYKQSHTGHSISCDVTGTKGYTYSYASSLETSDENKEIYIKTSTDKANAVWLASPSDLYPNYLVYAAYGGNLSSYYGNYDDNYPGLRPLICLNADVQLKKTGAGVYAIQ